MVKRKVTFAQSALQLGGSKPAELHESREISPLHRTQMLAGSRFKSHLNQDQLRRESPNPVLSSSSDVGLGLGNRSSLSSLSMNRDRGLGYSGIRHIVNSFTMGRKI